MSHTLHSLKVFSIKASLHLPFDHRLYVQNLTLQEFVNATVPYSAQTTFPYSFTVSKFLQPGSFDLAGSILYEVNEQLFQTVFYSSIFNRSWTCFAGSSQDMGLWTITMFF